MNTKLVDAHVFADALLAACREEGFHLSLMFATDDREAGQGFGVHAILSHDAEHRRLRVSANLDAADPRYPSVSIVLPAAHWYERAMADMFGIVPEGHPDLRRLIHHENIPLRTYPLRKDFSLSKKLAHADVPYPMQHVEGEGVYEIPVGPIHAGIIEPGHFRFNVAGERIITLEGKLFFTHKGVEKLMEGKTVEEGLPFAERVSGDASASHALAYCLAVESALGITVPDRANVLRSLVCELERVTMHIHDLANIGGMGTGYTVCAAQGFRIKERLMRASDEVFGNRFWRGFIVPGGVARDLRADELAMLNTVSKEAVEEMLAVVEDALASDGFRDRLETTGVLTKDTARTLGAVGIAARASGIDRDVRRDFPYAAYGTMKVPVAIKQGGDVFARYQIRIEELNASRNMIASLAKTKTSGSITAPVQGKDGFGLGAVESWRGESLAVVIIKNGLIDRCVIRDPSFCNWPLFGEIGPGNIVPDFPLCNKSLNLSYSGCDL